jgi:DNA repair protein RecN (Recombination protein N)
MLKSLSIQNFILIEDIEIAFHEGLNIITGETGAGKSIIIQALGLLLGNRLAAEPLFDKEKKCIIEATFDKLPIVANSYLEENDLNDGNNLIIRREITPQGKSRAFINDTPTNLNDLKELMAYVLDIHAQQETYSKLLSDTFFIEITDRLAENGLLIKEYQVSYHQWNSHNQKLQELKKQAQSSQNEVDFNVFLWKEIEELNLDIESDTSIEEKLSIIKNAESIKSALYNAIQILSDSEINVSDMLRDSYRLIGNAASEAGKELELLLENADAIIAETDDLIRGLNNFAEQVNFDEEEYQILVERNDKINRLLKKHFLQNVESLFEFQKDLKNKIDAYSHSETAINELEVLVQQSHKYALKLAKELSEKRQKQFNYVEEKITETLRIIGMQFAQVKISHQILDDKTLNLTGIDEIKLTLSPNKGASFKSLNEVGSGGEKSRLMLAIQDLLAGSIELPSLVLDEIDTGISGEVALKVGSLLKKMANNYQLISITHLPQIAAKSDRHFYVFKDNSNERSTSKVKVLNPQEQLNEIAMMLGGENYDSTAISHAKSLISN